MTFSVWKSLNGAAMDHIEELFDKSWRVCFAFYRRTKMNVDIPELVSMDDYDARQVEI